MKKIVYDIGDVVKLQVWLEGTRIGIILDRHINGIEPVTYKVFIQTFAAPRWVETYHIIEKIEDE